MKGRFDRVDRLANGEIAIIDFKTGKTKTQDDADDSLQLSVYALAAKALGHTASSLVFINLENGTAIESRRTPKQLSEAEEQVRVDCREDRRRRIRSQAQRRMLVVFVSEHLPGARRTASPPRDSSQPK